MTTGEGRAVFTVKAPRTMGKYLTVAVIVLSVGLIFSTFLFLSYRIHTSSKLNSLQNQAAQAHQDIMGLRSQRDALQSEIEQLPDTPPLVVPRGTPDVSVVSPPATSQPSRTTTTTIGSRPSSSSTTTTTTRPSSPPTTSPLTPPTSTPPTTSPSPPPPSPPSTLVCLPLIGCH